VSFGAGSEGVGSSVTVTLFAVADRRLPMTRSNGEGERIRVCESW
jgi:hypothetical protein